MIKLKELLKESKESLKEAVDGKLTVHPTDPDQTERSWVNVFKQLAQGHWHYIDYGPRESSIYDWNDQSNYNDAIKEYNKHMNKIAKCALTNINVIYGGDRFSVFDDSAPVQVDMTLQFKEVQLLSQADMNADGAGY